MTNLITTDELRAMFGGTMPMDAVRILFPERFEGGVEDTRPVSAVRADLVACAERYRAARLAHGGCKGRSLPVFDLTLRGPFAPSLYIRFGRRTSFILKRTRNELFSERHGYKRNRRFMGWSWHWQAIQAGSSDIP